MAKNKEITELTVTLLLPANEVPSRGRPPSRGRCLPPPRPLEADPPVEADPPPIRNHKSGRHASYWNDFLFY